MEIRLLQSLENLQAPLDVLMWIRTARTKDPFMQHFQQAQQVKAVHELLSRQVRHMVPIAAQSLKAQPLFAGPSQWTMLDSDDVEKVMQHVVMNMRTHLESLQGEVEFLAEKIMDTHHSNSVVFSSEIVVFEHILELYRTLLTLLEPQRIDSPQCLNDTL